MLFILSRSVYTFKAFHYKLFYPLVYRLTLMFHKKPWTLLAKRTFLLLPRKHRVYTVLRSTHTDKKAREQFELFTYKRALFCSYATMRKCNLFLSPGFRKYIIAAIPTGVGMHETVATTAFVKNI